MSDVNLTDVTSQARLAWSQAQSVYSNVTHDYL
jgi:hypothetical protein